MRIFFKTFLMVMLLSNHSMSATESTPIESAADQLGEGLGGLKNSVDKLSTGNMALTAKNNAIKLQLNQLQAQLQQLAEEHHALARSSLKLQEQAPARGKQLTQIEKDIFATDAKLEQIGEDIKISKDAIARSQEQDHQLDDRMTELGLKQPPVAAGPPAVVPDNKKEKLRLLKMIYESKDRQKVVHQQIIAVQKQLPLATPQSERASRKETLLAQARAAREEVEQLSKANASPKTAEQESWRQDQVRQLEVQVKGLQNSHDELEELVGRMQEKTQKMTLTAGQKREQNKLQASLVDLEKEALALRKNLNDLRLQMVDLDKRKTHLDSLARN